MHGNFNELKTKCVYNLLITQRVVQTHNFLQIKLNFYLKINLLLCFLREYFQQHSWKIVRLFYRALMFAGGMNFNLTFQPNVIHFFNKANFDKFLLLLHSSDKS